MEVAGHDTGIIEKYHGNRSKVKVTDYIVGVSVSVRASQ